MNPTDPWEPCCYWLYLIIVWWLCVEQGGWGMCVFVLSHSFGSNFLQLHGLFPSRLLCPWKFPGKNTGAGCHCLLQGIFPTQGLNPRLLHCRQILYHRVTREASLCLTQRTMSTEYSCEHFFFLTFSGFPQSAREDAEFNFLTQPCWTPPALLSLLRGTGSKAPFNDLAAWQSSLEKNTLQIE